MKTVTTNIFPTTYFSKIELSNRGIEFKRESPYIEEDQERVLYSGLAGPKKFKQKKPSYSSFSPPLSIVATVGFVMPESQGKLYDEFFDDEFYGKFLKVKVIKINNFEAIQKLIAAKSIKEISKLASMGKMETKDFSIKEFETGEDLEDNSLRVVFSNRNENPPFLSIASVVYLDIDKIEEEYDAELNSSELAKRSMSLSIENIIVNNRVVSEAFTFFDDSGQPFTGAVEVRSGEYYILGTETKLEFKAVPNTTVLDFRSIESSKRVEKDFSEVYEKLGVLFKDNTSLGSPVFEVPRQYFSNCMITSDPSGRARFALGINQYNIIKYNCAFPWLIDSPESEKMKEIYSLSLISNIKVVRERVFKTDDFKVPFKNSKEESVLDTSEKEYGNLQERDLKDVSGDNISQIREIPCGISGVRMLSISDEYMAKINMGTYDYKVYLTMEDGTIEYVYKKLNALLELSEKLSEIKRDLTNSRSYNPVRDELSEAKREEIKNGEDKFWNYIPTSLIEIVYSLFGQDITNTFSVIRTALTPDVINVSNLSGVEGFVNKIIQNIQSQLNSVGSFTSNLSKNYPTKDAVRSRASSNTSKIEIEKSIGGEFNSAEDGRYGVDFLHQLDSSGRSIPFVEERGLNVINGIDYESRIKKETSKYFGANASDTSIMTKRKQYSSGDTIDRNSFTYLSPSLVKHDLGEISVNNSNAFDQDKMTLTELNLSRTSEGIVSIAENNHENISSKDLETKVQKNALLAFSSNFRNIQVLPDITETDILKTETLSNTALSKSPLDSSGEQKVINTNPIFKELYKSSKDGPDVTAQNKGTYFDVKSPENALDVLNLSEVEVLEIPNQIKSLFLSSAGDTNVINNIFMTPDLQNKDIDHLNSSTFRMNYDFLRKVEYLEGFNSASNGDVLTKSPIWKPLTKESYQNSTKKELLCRMIKYKSRVMPTRNIDGKEIPTYNSYFVIRTNYRASAEENLKGFSAFRKELDEQILVSPKYINTGVFSIDV